MIRVLVVHIARNGRGQPIRTESRVAGETLRIGRGAECKIHLPDHRVNLHHALVRTGDDGRHFVEGEGAVLNVGGMFTELAELVPGTRVLVGPYALVAETPGRDEDLVLTVELVHPLLAQAAGGGGDAPTSLAAAGLSKRRYALISALAILALFLGLPLWYATHTGLRAAAAALPAAADEVWLPGPLAAGHRQLTTQCHKCHQRPFEAVPDAACQTCHEGPRFHAGKKAAAQAGAPAPLRCTGCHRDHKGSDRGGDRGSGLIRHDAPLCVGCHGRIKRLDSASGLPDIHDFDADHPAFSVSLPAGPGTRAVRRVAQQDKARLVENSGLRFSHQAHAGKLRVPSDPQTVRTLGCADCHEAERGGKGFLPLSEKRHCHGCHAENFDFNPPLEGERLPHGSLREVLVALTDFHARRAAGDKAAARMPPPRVMELAAARAADAARALDGDMGCGLCHATVPAAAGAAIPWQVPAPSLNARWLPRARFDHARHRTGGCAACHEVARSQSSADVAIPAIAKCRECHGGERPPRRKVPSTCTACHDYHDPQSAHGRGAAPGQG